MQVDRRRQTTHHNHQPASSMARSYHSPNKAASTRCISLAKHDKTQILPHTIREIAEKPTKQLSVAL